MALRFSEINRRNWPDVVDHWSAHVPDIEPPGTPPHESQTHSFGVVEIFDRFGDTDKFFSAELSPLRAATLHCAFYLSHKVAHYSNRSLDLVHDGRPTAATTVAYQAALLAARAISRYYGIILWTHPDGGRNYLVDVWPSKDGKRTEVQDILVLKSPKFESRHEWELLKRLAAVVRNNSFSTDLAWLLKKDVSHFARQRNRLHYRDTAWIFQDLLEKCTISEDMLSPVQLRKDLDHRTNWGYTLQVSLLLRTAVTKLSSDLAEKVPKLKPEYVKYCEQDFAAGETAA